MKALKYSRQRESIKEYLADRTDHPTADTIYLAIKEKYPNISLGTVYRNLSLLSEMGEIAKISCGGVAEHFDGNSAPHYHFVCNECNKISDIHIDNMDFINTLAEKSFDGKVIGHNAYFYGICSNCNN